MKRWVAVGALASALGVGAALWMFRRSLKVVLEMWQANTYTPTALAACQHERLARLIAFARARSPYYRALYQHLPADISEITALPIVTKPDLMANFDEWVTDPAVTRAGVGAFINDPTLIGKHFLGQYTVWSTSGTTGKPGIFVHDRQASSVYEAIDLLRKFRWLTPTGLVRLARRPGTAIVAATGAHYGVVDWFEQLRQRWAWAPPLGNSFHVLSALSPLGELVRSLNALQPGMLGGYPSIIALLAEEQRAGRLRIAPIYVGVVGEELGAHTRRQIEEAFNCIVRDIYGASEFPGIAYECERGWLHVNADWLVLEPVDAAYQPVPPGRPSSTVLLTNLANYTQPLIRYDLGDSITVKPDPCACGFPLPAIRVEGRKADVLRLATPSGKLVAIPPLAIGTVVEETPGVRRAQIIQTAPNTLTLRLEVEHDVKSPVEVWDQVERRLRDYLAPQGVPSISLVRGPEAPQQSPMSGKFRQVWSAAPTPSVAGSGDISGDIS